MWIIVALLSLNIEAAVDALYLKEGRVYTKTGEQEQLLPATINLPDDVEVKTNGVFKVAKGAERKLKEGQILQWDGTMINPDGSVLPVIDHIAIKDGKAMMTKDGETTQIIAPLVWPVGTVLPDATLVKPSGVRTRLTDGLMFKLDGTSLPARDSITLMKGQVIIQRDGTLLKLLGWQTMGMSDGTKVKGDGTVTRRDGREIKLHEGQTLVVEGAAITVR